MTKRRVRAFATIRAGHAPIKCAWLSSRQGEDEEADGFYSAYPGVLAVQGNLSVHVGAETFVHELLHVAMEMAGIDDDSIPETEEALVKALTKPISSLVAHNPAMAHWLVDAFSSKEKTIVAEWNAAKKRRK